MSTVVDDWGEHAFFSGMPLGPLGNSYSFNGGRAILSSTNGQPLVIEDVHHNRGVLLAKNAPVLLKIHKPSLLLDLSYFLLEYGIKIEKATVSDAEETHWSSDPLLEDYAVQGADIRKLYTSTLLQCFCLFRISVENVGVLKTIVNIDCTQCSNLRNCK